jgi:hypothetical protein
LAKCSPRALLATSQYWKKKKRKKKKKKKTVCLPLEAQFPHLKYIYPLNIKN